MAKRQGTPLWVTVGCGCGLLVLMLIGAIVATGFFSVTAFRGYVEDMKDPIARAEKAGEILGAEALPEGYTAHVFLRIPWLVDIVLLSDSEPVVIEDENFELESDAIGRHLFAYFSLPRSDMDHAELERMLRGESDADGVQTDIDLEVESAEELARGSFELGDQRLSYVSHRGELDLDGGAVEGIYSQVLIDCPGDERTRAAVWFQRSGQGGESEPDAAGTTGAGTPADEEALRRFMDHFELCRD